MDKVAELNLTVEETVEVQRFKIDMDNSEYAKISHLNPSFYKQFSSGMNKLTPAQRELFNLWMDSNNLDSKKSLLLYQDNDICSATDECEKTVVVGAVVENVEKRLLRPGGPGQACAHGNRSEFLHSIQCRTWRGNAWRGRGYGFADARFAPGPNVPA